MEEAVVVHEVRVCVPANVLHPHLCFWRHLLRFTLHGKRKLRSALGYLLIMGLYNRDITVFMPLTSSSSLKTDASPVFFGGSDGAGSLGF